MEASFDFTPPTQIGRKLIRIQSPKSLGERNLKLLLDKMNKQQLEQTTETINEDPTAVAIIINNGNENQ